MHGVLHPALEDVDALIVFMEGRAVLHLRTRPFVWTREEGATALRSAAAPANVANEEEFRKAVSAAALEQDGSLLWTTP